MANTTTDREVIDKIGDAALIELGYTPERVKQWRYRAISWSERPKIHSLATERGIELPDDFLHRQRPHQKPKAMKASRRRRAA